jgi:hypothetical protein
MTSAVTETTQSRSREGQSTHEAPKESILTPRSVPYLSVESHTPARRQ